MVDDPYRGIDSSDATDLTRLFRELAASGAAVGTGTWSAAAVPLVIGSNTITVTAIDSSQKVAQSLRVTRTVSPITSPVSSDRTPPTLRIATPAGSIITTTAATIELKGTAADNIAVSKVTWQGGGATGTATGTTNWTAGPIPLFVGDNNILVRAYDIAGNMSWKSLLVIRR